MKTIKKMIYVAAIICFFCQGFFYSACSDWTEMEAKDYWEEPHSEQYYRDLKEYFKSPHRVMFGWYGNWIGKAGSSMQNALCGLPDSADFVSLWLCWGNLTPAQQADLKDFQAKGSRAVLCWRAGDIGDNLTPGGNARDNKEKFWGIVPDDENSYLEAAKKYALAIVDTCNKYNIDGFDYDIEDDGTLMTAMHPERANTFMRTLREEFDKTGKMLLCDIPGGNVWLRYYDILAEDVVESLDYIVWQTYEPNYNPLDYFFDDVKRRKPEIFDNVLKKSIITATFERGGDKHWLRDVMESYQYNGQDVGGIGAYHIEYDYPGNPDYPTVRAAIAAQNAPKNEEKGVDNEN